MKEYTITEFCIEFGILFYEEDVFPFAYSEGWYKSVDILDAEGNAVDTEKVLDASAINDTLSRMHTGIEIQTAGNYVFA